MMLYQWPYQENNNQALDFIQMQIAKVKGSNLQLKWDDQIKGWHISLILTIIAMDYFGEHKHT